MIHCATCSSPAPEGARYCPSCAAPLTPVSKVATVMERHAGPPPPAPFLHARHPPSSDSSAEGRFIAGTLLAGRYRIVSLLGRGGMGEVYRADDLKLGQPVALKFLPLGLEKDGARLSRLLNEVRTARQISHPNVCRVYDIGEMDGQHFLTMEYVDGEDLATLLRRIGRLPKDKAIQIARQTCAGLAAAHEQGILHRDLKPANVMMDGRGRVRITDFGLAGLVETIQGNEVQAGTPAYMAPEQVAGREVSARSDLYSLGLVLYEVFTGKPVFKAATLAERAKQQRETTPTSPSTLIEGIDPAVERAILRCHEVEPRERPSSALALAAALPGGDPLAAALAAGETPSPEMVADAGEAGGLSPAVACGCLAGILLGAALTILGSGGSLMARRIPLELPPEALAERAREITRRLGYTEPATDSAYGFKTDEDYVRYVELNDASPARWEGLATGRPAAVYYWFRQSPRYLEVTGIGFEVRLSDPPEDVSGMRHVLLDPKGRLIDFLAVPAQIDDPGGPWNEPDWPLLFTEAGLEVAKFTPAASRWVPPVYADSRAAWEGSLPARPGTSIRVEAGAYRGRPVYFQVLGPWSRPARMKPFQQATLAKVAGVVAPIVSLSAVFGGALLARRNLRLGRGDRRGSFRLAFCMFSLLMLSWLCGASHVPTLEGELGLFVRALAFALLGSAVLWLFYIALEPYVRRRWPGMIISWSRLIAGRLRDPLVGRDILIGGLCGIAFALADPLYHLLPAWLGLPPQAPHPIDPRMLLGVRHLVSGILGTQVFSMFSVLFFCFVLVLLRILLRWQWLAAAAFFLFYTITISTGAGNPYINVLYAAVLGAIVTFTLIRLGLLAAAVLLFLPSVLLGFPLTLDFSVWYASNSLFGLSVSAILVLYGFFVSLAGRSLFREEMLEA